MLSRGDGPGAFAVVLNRSEFDQFVGNTLRPAQGPALAAASHRCNNGLCRGTGSLIHTRAQAKHGVDHPF